MDYNTTTANGTIGYKFDPMIEVFKVLVTCIMALVMFGMGCAVEHDKLFQHFKRPVAIGLGLFCQVVLMPIFAYALIKATSMSELQANIFMVVGCSPGGTFSNILAYWIDGDMSLSVALTTISNIMALGTVPFWIFLYTHVEHVDSKIRIPYSSLGISLASLIIPIVAGIIFRYKFIKAGKYFVKGCGVFGVIFLVVIIVAMFVRNEIPIIFSVKTIVPIAVLPVAGMVISYLISLIPKQLNNDVRRTIAVETSIQNGSFSNNVVFLTYAHDLSLFVQVITIPLLYSIAQIIYNILIISIYKLWQLQKKCQNRKISISNVSTDGYEYINM